MKRQNYVLAAIMALAPLAMAQEPQDERIEVKVVGPTGGVQVVEGGDLDVDLDLVDPLEGAAGAFILGVEGQDADETKGGKPQDEGTIVREIDLGDGRKMRIIITTEVKGGAKGESLRRFKLGLPDLMKRGAVDHQGFTLIGPEGMKGFDPHGFDVKVFGGEVKDHMERALKAFDRAREEFIRAFKEGGPAEGHATEPKKKLPEKRGWAVKVPKAETHEKAAEAERKAKVEHEVRKIEGEIKKTRPGEVRVLEVSPGAASKQAREIEELRKEMKELEKMVRELKDELRKKGE